MSLIKHAPPYPELRPLDEGYPTINFQFPPISFTENRAANWASQTGMTRENPILQFSNGEQRSFQFQARIWAHNESVSVEPIIDELKRATERDPDLGRPPRWSFVWGTAVSETVVVRSIGNIRYDELRPDGSLRGALLQIELLVWRFTDVEFSGEPTPSTHYVVLRQGDTWEGVALKEYGDPDLGDLLRRRNPATLFPGCKPGTVVELPPRQKLLDEAELEPDSGPLRRTEEALEERARLFEARSQPRESLVLKH